MAMQQVWRTLRQVKIEKLGDNVFMFKFGSKVDKRGIMVGGPWHFDRALIVLTEPAGIRDIKKQDFSHVSFWVQIHDVPIMCMSKEMVAELGKVIGKVEEVETDAAGECLISEIENIRRYHKAIEEDHRIRTRRGRCG